jgi:hypothetical protein
MKFNQNKYFHQQRVSNHLTWTGFVMKTFIFQCTYIHNSCIVFFIYYRFLSGGHLFIPLYSMVGRRKRFVGESSLICVWLNGLMERGKKKWEFLGLRKRPKWNHDDDCCVQNTWYSSSNSRNKEKAATFAPVFLFLRLLCNVADERNAASSTAHSDMLGKECAWWMPSSVHMESGS